MLKRIKTITSHSGLARFLAETVETPNYLARVQTLHIPSPYRYSPTVDVLRWRGKDVAWFETRHRRYEVYEIKGERCFLSEDDATAYHISTAGV